MSTRSTSGFDEREHPRDGSGQFARKPAAPPAGALTDRPAVPAPAELAAARAAAEAAQAQAAQAQAVCAQAAADTAALLLRTVCPEATRAVFWHDYDDEPDYRLVAVRLDGPDGTLIGSDDQAALLEDPSLTDAQRALVLEAEGWVTQAHRQGMAGPHMPYGLDWSDESDEMSGSAIHTLDLTRQAG